MPYMDVFQIASMGREDGAEAYIIMIMCQSTCTDSLDLLTLQQPLKRPQRKSVQEQELLSRTISGQELFRMVSGCIFVWMNTHSTSVEAFGMCWFPRPSSANPVRTHPPTQHLCMQAVTPKATEVPYALHTSFSPCFAVACICVGPTPSFVARSDEH